MDRYAARAIANPSVRSKELITVQIVRKKELIVETSARAVHATHTTEKSNALGERMKMKNVMFGAIAFLLIVSAVGFSECVGFQCNAVKFVGHGIISIFVPTQHETDVYAASLPGTLTNVTAHVFTYIWGMSVVGNQIIDYVKKQTDVNVDGSAFNKAARKVTTGYTLPKLLDHKISDDPMAMIYDDIINYKFLKDDGLGISTDEAKKIIGMKVSYDSGFYAPWWYDEYSGDSNEKCIHASDTDCNSCKNGKKCKLMSYINENTGKQDKPPKKYYYSDIYGKQPSLNIEYIMDIEIYGKLAKYFYFIAKQSFVKELHSFIRIFKLDTINKNKNPVDMYIKRQPFRLVFRIHDYPIILNCSKHDGQYYHYDDMLRYQVKCAGQELYTCGIKIKGIKGDPCDTAWNIKHPGGNIVKDGCPPKHIDQDHIEEVDSMSDFDPKVCESIKSYERSRQFESSLETKINSIPKSVSTAELHEYINETGKLVCAEILYWIPGGSNIINGEKKEIVGQEEKCNTGGGRRELDYLMYTKGKNSRHWIFEIGSVDKSDCRVKMSVGQTYAEDYGVYLYPTPDDKTYTYCLPEMTHSGLDGDPENIHTFCCWATGGTVMYNPGREYKRDVCTCHGEGRYRDCVCNEVVYFKENSGYFCKGDGYCDNGDGEYPWNSPDCWECAPGPSTGGCWIGEPPNGYNDPCNHVKSGEEICIDSNSYGNVEKCENGNWANCRALCNGNNSWSFDPETYCCHGGNCKKCKEDGITCPSSYSRYGYYHISCKLPGVGKNLCDLDIYDTIRFRNGKQCGCSNVCAGKCGGISCNFGQSKYCCDSRIQVCCPTYDSNGEQNGNVCCPKSKGCGSNGCASRFP